MAGEMRGVAVVAHGGGPTRVINSSLAGVVWECALHEEITALYGARHGILGVLGDDFVDLGRQAPETIRAIAGAPGSAIGSCRRKLTPDDYERILAVFRAHDVRYFFYNGGNDSMDTAHRLARLAGDRGYEVRVVGIPKTIDNDLAETDHCPGYGSAALFIGEAVRDIGEDNRTLPCVSVVEVMGRNAGWLAAASALARRSPEDAPHLIYLPERPLSEDKLLADVEEVYSRLGRVVVVVSEGLTNEYGEPFGAETMRADGFGHNLTENLAATLAQLLKERLDIRARSEKPGLLSRSSTRFVSEIDREEAALCGRAAVRFAVEGVTGKMVTLVREAGESYRCTTGLANLERVANAERLFPLEWIDPSGHDVLPAFLDYAGPLAGEIAPHARLESIRVRGKGVADELR